MARPRITVRSLAFDSRHSLLERSAEFGCVLEGVFSETQDFYHDGVLILREIDGDLGHRLRVDISNCSPGILIFAPSENLPWPQRYASELVKALENLLTCPDLNLDELEDSTREAVKQGWDVLHKATGVEASK